MTGEKRSKVKERVAKKGARTHTRIRSNHSRLYSYDIHVYSCAGTRVQYTYKGISDRFYHRVYLRYSCIFAQFLLFVTCVRSYTFTRVCMYTTDEQFGSIGVFQDSSRFFALM